MSINRRHSTGLSMIEILITVLLVNFSIIALTKMQITNYTSINNSILSLKAAFLAEALTEKMRINSALAKTASSPYLLPSYTDTPTNMATSNVCISATCDSNGLAQYDMNTWLFKLKSNFPLGKAKVTKVDSTGYSMYTISIQWQYKDKVSSYDVVVPI